MLFEFLRQPTKPNTRKFFAKQKFMNYFGKIGFEGLCSYSIAIIKKKFINLKLLPLLMKSKSSLVMMYGYPATGKTCTSGRMARYLGQYYTVDKLTTLSMRTSLGLFDLTSDDEREMVYSEMARLANVRLAEGLDFVILDGNFNRKARREPIYTAVYDNGIDLYIVECVVTNESIIERRMEERKRSPDIPENYASTMDLYFMIKISAEPVGQDQLPDGSFPRIITYDTEKSESTTHNCGDLEGEQKNTLNLILKSLD